jgi:hypothetical protein
VYKINKLKKEAKAQQREDYRGIDRERERERER